MNVIPNIGKKTLNQIEFGECFLFESDCYMLVDSPITIKDSVKAVKLMNGHVIDLDLYTTVWKVNNVELCD